MWTETLTFSTQTSFDKTSLKATELSFICVGLYPFNWQEHVMHYSLPSVKKKTPQKKTSAVFSEDKKTVLDPNETQHDPFLPLTGEWNCIWGSISSESSLFSGGFVYRALSSEVKNHLRVFSERHVKGKGLFNEVISYTRQVAAPQAATRTGLRVPHREAVGERPWFDGSHGSLLRVCLSPFTAFREEGSGRPREDVLASSGWCLRFNRWTTAAVMDVKTRHRWNDLCSSVRTSPNKSSK